LDKPHDDNDHDDTFTTIVTLSCQHSVTGTDNNLNIFVSIRQHLRGLAACKNHT